MSYQVVRVCCDYQDDCINCIGNDNFIYCGYIMARKPSLNQKVVQFLKNNQGKKFKAREIAEHIYMLDPHSFKDKLQGFNSEKELFAQIAAEIGSQRQIFLKESCPVQLQDKPRPRLYWYEDKKTISVDEAQILQETDQNNLKENDLYPLLMKYLNQEFKLYCLRIDEKKSRNSKGMNGNKWLHPDIVAMQPIDKEWIDSIKICAERSIGQSIRLWSFEVKKSINISNVRECFFQTVSNSSWANEGYLVTASITSDALDEMRILSALHGIGLITLNINDLSQSEIILPAKRKDAIDWQSVNRIVSENKDFETYVRYISVYYQTKEIFPDNWNK